VIKITEIFRNNSTSSSSVRSNRISSSFDKQQTVDIPFSVKFIVMLPSLYSVEITYGINSIISKLMTFVENAETGQFLFLVILILSYDVITNFFK
jgi:hypothetical protein